MACHGVNAASFSFYWQVGGRTMSRCRIHMGSVPPHFSIGSGEEAESGRDKFKRMQTSQRCLIGNVWGWRQLSADQTCQHMFFFIDVEISVVSFVSTYVIFSLMSTCVFFLVDVDMCLWLFDIDIILCFIDFNILCFCFIEVNMCICFFWCRHMTLLFISFMSTEVLVSLLSTCVFGLLMATCIFTNLSK